MAPTTAPSAIKPAPEARDSAVVRLGWRPIASRSSSLLVIVSPSVEFMVLEKCTVRANRMVGSWRVSCFLNGSWSNKLEKNWMHRDSASTALFAVLWLKPKIGRAMPCLFGASWRAMRGRRSQLQRGWVGC